MDKDNPLSNKVDLALSRYAAVNWIEQSIGSGLTFQRSVALASERSWGGRYYAVSTLERWFYIYRHGRFEALKTKTRSDKGSGRVLGVEAVEALIALRREHPQMTVSNLARELVRRNVLKEGTFSLPTLYRCLAAAGLDTQSVRNGAGKNGPTKAFELPLANALWMADSMCGPTLSQTGKKPVRTWLFSIIDDCSRLVPHAQYYEEERIRCFLDTLRQAVLRRGVADKLYTDNGNLFVSRHLAVVCANLEIKLIHAKPYHAWSKGKQERFYSTVQQNFEQRLVFSPVHNLAELNQRFWRWLEEEYHQRPHSSLEGQSPSERFAQRSQGLRLLPANLDVEALFLAQTTRRVRQDATFSLEGILWEVPASLRGHTVDIHYDPFGWNRVEIYMREEFICKAHRCDKQRNAQTFKTEDLNDF